MVKNTLFFIACLLITITKIYSQASLNTPIQFPSPEAANLGIVGTLPVSLHTGKVSVSIPVSSGDVKNIPAMSLSYNTGGIMPDFHPGWTGLNWTLNAGGVVTRMMNFIPDETPDAGFYYTSWVINTTAYIDPLSFFGTEYCWNNLCATADAAADEFYVNAPGLSGKFEIGSQGKFMMLEDPSAKIESEGMGFDMSWGYVDLAYKPFKGFTITKNDGTKYRFGYAAGLIETTIPVPKTPDPSLDGVASSWYLAQIIYPNGETVNYSYTPKVMDYTPTGNDRNIHSYLYDDLYGGDLPPTDGRSDTWGEAGMNRTATYHAYLQSIESSLARIDFYTSTSNELKNGSSDWGHWKKLDQIVIYDKLQAKTDKTITFNYDPSPKKRLTLLSIVTKNGNNETLPPYEFTYDPNPLPPYQSGQLDFWGYFNNTTYSSMIPSVVWPDQTDDFYYSPNREPNIRCLGNGMLQQIKYPTGGTVSLEYEPNEYSYYRQYVTQNQGVPLTQVKWGWEQQQYNSGESSYYYNWPKKKFLYTGSAPVVLSSYANAWISGTGISNGQVSKVLEPGTYTHESIQQLLGIPYYIGNSYTINYMELVPMKKNVGPGLRIKRVVHKSSNASIDLVHEYVYSKNFNQPGFDPELSSGILGNRGAFVAGASRTGNPGVAYCNSQSPEILTEGSPLGYSEVADITKDKDGNMLGYVINKYSNFDTNPDEMPTVTGPNSMLLAKKNNKYYERGKLRETATYGNLGQLMTKTVNYYHNQFYEISKGITGLPDLIVNSGGGVISTELFIRYTDYFGSALLESQDQIQYSQKANDYVQTHTIYQYDKNNFPQLIKTSTSTGEKKQTITYPSDYSTPVFSEMVSKNMSKIPIETINYKDGKVINGELNTYKSVTNGNGSLVLKDNYYRLSLQTPAAAITPYDGSTVITDYESPLLQFTTYDAKGNLLETKDRQGITTSYLWGYVSQYPVAKIIGSDYNTVKNFVNQNILDNLNGQYSDVDIRTELNKIRIGLSGTATQVSTYTYSPLHGITSETGTRDRTTFFEYDGFGRLSYLRDQDKNILKKFCYNYTGQQSTCDIVGNVAKSKTFTKSGCDIAAGLIGSPVSYTIPGNTYFGPNADALAQNDLNTNGQAKADQNGTCVIAHANVVKSRIFTKNCSLGGVPSTVTYTVPAGTYHAYSQQAADQLAQDDVDVNGQTYANSNGYCTWFNERSVFSYQKNNCPAGATGSSVVDYIVPQGKYSSTIGLTDANNKATNDANANGQSYANANGVCIWYNWEMSVNFQKNDCPSGSTGTWASYVVPANKYSSTISQDDAIAQAEEDLYGNGQAYANENGSCELNTINILYTNSGGVGVEVWFYSTTTEDVFYFRVPPYSSDVPLAMPPGTYDIVFWPMDSGRSSHYFTAGCNYWASGYDVVTIYGVSFQPDQYGYCNTIYSD